MRNYIPMQADFKPVHYVSPEDTPKVIPKRWVWVEHSPKNAQRKDYL